MKFGLKSLFVVTTAFAVILAVSFSAGSKPYSMAEGIFRSITISAGAVVWALWATWARRMLTKTTSGCGAVGTAVASRRFGSSSKLVDRRSRVDLRHGRPGRFIRAIQSRNRSARASPVTWLCGLALVSKTPCARINRLWIDPFLGEEDIRYHNESYWAKHIYGWYEERLADCTADLPRGNHFASPRKARDIGVGATAPNREPPGDFRHWFRFSLRTYSRQ